MRPETSSSLKAVHSSWRLATDIDRFLHPIDPLTQPCPHCSRPITLDEMLRNRSIRCPACDVPLPLPPHIRQELVRRDAANHTWDPVKDPIPAFATPLPSHSTPLTLPRMSPEPDYQIPTQPLPVFYRCVGTTLLLLLLFGVLFFLLHLATQPPITPGPNTPTPPPAQSRP